MRGFDGFCNPTSGSRMREIRTYGFIREGEPVTAPFTYHYKKPGLKKLLKLIHQEKFTHLILNHKDRLLRFGSEIIFSLCQQRSIEVIILEESDEKSFEMELSCDVIELMTVFSARLYGRRSHQNRRRKAA